MDGMQAEAVTVEPAPATDRPVWQKPEITEVAISDVTNCCYAFGGSDTTPSVTSLS